MIIAGIILGCAIFILATAMMVGPATNLFLGFLNLVIGTQMFLQPMLVLRDGQAELKNLFGMTVRRKEFDSFSQLKVEGNTLYLYRDGERTKVSQLNKFFCHGPDVDALKQFLESQ
jgi:hypothetical protein